MNELVNFLQFDTMEWFFIKSEQLCRKSNSQRIGELQASVLIGNPAN